MTAVDRDPGLQTSDIWSSGDRCQHATTQTTSVVGGWIRRDSWREGDCCANGDSALWRGDGQPKGSWRAAGEQLAWTREKRIAFGSGTMDEIIHSSSITWCCNC